MGDVQREVNNAVSSVSNGINGGLSDLGNNINRELDTPLGHGALVGAGAMGLGLPALQAAGLGLGAASLGGLLGAGGGQKNYGVNFDKSAFDPSQAEQEMTGQLIARSNGLTPSVAEQQMRAGQQQAQAQSMGSAASARGVSPALAARLQAQQQGQNSGQANQQAGMMRAAEQQQAQANLQRALESQRQARMGREQLGVTGQMGANNLSAQRDMQQTGMMGNLLGGAATGAMLAFMNKGGKVPGYSQGGEIPAEADPSFNARFAEGLKAIQALGNVQAPQQDNKMLGQFGEQLGKMVGKTDKVNALSMAGGPLDTITPDMNGGMFPNLPGNPMAPDMFMPAAHGAVVPGQANVAGDSPKNDTVLAALSPDEVVVPRSIAKMSPDVIAAWVKKIQERGA